MSETVTEAAAQAVAQQCGARVLIGDSVSETSQAWALPSGQVQQEISSAPVRVRRGDTWVPVDLDLIRHADGSITSVAHPERLTIAGASDEAGLRELAAVGDGDDRVAMGWTGNLPDPVLDGPKATYADVEPGVDLVLEATPRGVESFYVLQDRTAIQHVEQLTVPIVGQSVSAHKLTADGRLTLLDEANKAVATSPTPLMWDARTDKLTGRPAQTRALDTEATTRPAADTSPGAAPIDGQGVDLTLTPDLDFLTDLDTVYPVTIDPELAVGSPTFDTYVRRGSAHRHFRASGASMDCAECDGPVGVRARSARRRDGDRGATGIAVGRSSPGGGTGTADRGGGYGGSIATRG